MDPDNPDADEGICGSNGSTSFIKVEEEEMFGDNRENSFGIKKSDLGVVIGTGITINRFYFGLQYDMGLKNLANKSAWAPGYKFRNNSITIQLGFNLYRNRN